MFDTCRECNKPIYPYGITYTGPSCSYGGRHPSMPLLQLNGLTQSISLLTKAIESLNETMVRAKAKSGRKLAKKEREDR